MKFIKISSETIAWHISNAKFSKFDNQMAAQGIFWFATDREHLIEDLHGASINSSKPVWLYKVKIVSNKAAGWKEYDKYVLNQLEQMGYDIIDLNGDLAVFDPNNIEILEVSRIR